MEKKNPRLCFVGHLLGRNPGYVTTQGQITADLFSKEGHQVISVSSKINRVLRMTDIIYSIAINQRNIDVVILEVYSGASMLMADAVSYLCKLLKIPLILVLHGGALPDFYKRHPSWTMRVLKRADALVAPSSFLAKEITKLNLEVRVIPNIIQIDKYPYKLRQNIGPKLIWMRSFHPIYNPQMAVKVFFEILKKEPAATLVMAGSDKGLEREIKSLAHQLKIKNSILFPGFLGIEEKVKQFSSADIYLNTNKIDNMPVSLIEACAFGLPVVATNVGGISELISNKQNGMLVPDNDIDAMVKAIFTLLSNPKLTKTISQNGRILADQSSWKNVRFQWEDLFSEVISRKTFLN